MSRFPFSNSYPMGWYQVAYSDELPAKGVIPLKYFSRDLVAWRTESGTAVVSDAICPHLGAHLGHGGWVAGDCIACPFHGWEYDTTGACASVPYSERVNKKAKIRTYPVVEQSGLVLIWWHPDGAEPQWQVPGVPEFEDATYTDYYRERWTIRTSPQEMAENQVDTAHFRWVHGTVHVPEIDEVEEKDEVMRVRTRQVFDTPMGPTDGFIESNSWAFGYSIVRFSGIVDTTLVGCNTPIDDEHVDLRFSFMYRKLGDNEKVNSRVGEALINDIRKQIAEDRVIWENKHYVEVPALVQEDGPFRQFRNWARQFYVTDWDSEGATEVLR